MGWYAKVPLGCLFKSTLSNNKHIRSSISLSQKFCLNLQRKFYWKFVNFWNCNKKFYVNVKCKKLQMWPFPGPFLLIFAIIDFSILPLNFNHLKFFMGVLDSLNLFVMGVMDGWYSIKGAVYCACPDVLYIKGSLMMSNFLFRLKSFEIGINFC